MIKLTYKKELIKFCSPYAYGPFQERSFNEIHVLITSTKGITSEMWIHSWLCQDMYVLSGNN